MDIEKLSILLGRDVTLAGLPASMSYAPADLKREGLKGLAGCAICAGVVAGLNPAPLIGWPLGLAGVLFAAYAAQQWRRSGVAYDLDEGGLSGGGRLLLPWEKMSGLRLSFYPHGRRSAQGTLVLTLHAGKTRLKLDSTLSNFPALLQHAAAAAKKNDLIPDPTTASNLEKLGL